jgi:hypothetical protein
VSEEGLAGGDPAKADGEESAYQYCDGNPVGHADASGLATASHGYTYENDNTGADRLKVWVRVHYEVVNNTHLRNCYVDDYDNWGRSVAGTSWVCASVDTSTSGYLEGSGYKKRRYRAHVIFAFQRVTSSGVQEARNIRVTGMVYGHIAEGMQRVLWSIDPISFSGATAHSGWDGDEH